MRSCCCEYTHTHTLSHRQLKVASPRLGRFCIFQNTQKYSSVEVFAGSASQLAGWCLPFVVPAERPARQALTLISLFFFCIFSKQRPSVCLSAGLLSSSQPGIAFHNFSPCTCVSGRSSCFCCCCCSMVLTRLITLAVNTICCCCFCCLPGLTMITRWRWRRLAFRQVS